MHTYDGEGCVISHNSDGSGMVHITAINVDPHARIEVPCADLIGFVANLVRSRRIERLEDMDDEELLGLEPDHRSPRNHKISM